MSNENTNTKILSFGSESKSRQSQFLSFYACGLKSKMLCPDFRSFIGKYDIIGVKESKLDDLDKIQVPAYQVFFLQIIVKHFRDTDRLI